MTSRKPSTLPTGIARTPTGYRTAQWVPDPSRPQGRIVTKRWKADATIKAMVAWREDQRVAARQQTPPATPPTITGFAADVVTYLAAVRGMPSYSNRVRDIREWVALFGETPRSQILPVTILTARNRWLAEGPKRVQVRLTPDAPPQWMDRPIPLAPSTVNKRLRALENVFTVLDGRHAYNPVRDVPECDEPPPQPKGQTFALSLEILAHMPDVTTPKKGGLAEPGSLSRVRFETMLWTGLPAVQLARLQPTDVDWIAGTVLPPRRQKGKRSRRARRRQERPRPLLPQALEALTRFFALGANRSCSASALSRAVKAAIRAANRVRAQKRQPPISLSLTVYELTRHCYATEAYRASGDLKAVQELLGHADIKQTERYALAAVNERTALAMTAFTKAVRSAGKVSRAATGRPGSSRRARNRRKARKSGAPGRN